MKLRELLEGPLQGLKELCDQGCKEELELQMRLEQHKTTKNNKALTVVMILFYPVALAAAMFSMPSEMLPLKPTLSSFVFSILIFATLLTFALTTILNQSWLWRIFIVLIGLRPRISKNSTTQLVYESTDNIV